MKRNNARPRERDSHARDWLRPRSGKHGPAPIFGIDGEGQTLEGSHRYVLLAIAGEHEGAEDYVHNPAGLSSAECFDFILSLDIPRNARLFGYAFGYDLTKILTDVDNASIHSLYRPETRRRFIKSRKFPSHYPVEWGDYELNWLAGKFIVARKGKPKERRAIWDIFKFYQSRFVASCESWGVGTPETRARMHAMKTKRSDFAQESLDAIRAYCFEECRYMAQLGRKLIDAHDAVDLTLKDYYGAGSSGKAALTALNVIDCKKPLSEECPPEMQEAVSSAFFGGRFENSRIGLVAQASFNFDISSAYPYQQTFLPCLAHCTWKHTTDRAQVDERSLVRYSLDKARTTKYWGPFPFRTSEGTILYPNGSGGGWVWGAEYLMGERYFDGVKFHSAWVYRKGCDCRPFTPREEASIPYWYRKRVQIGKDGPGIVLKLALNSMYGKLAQSTGGGSKFTSWIWAGMITSGTRAQLLEAYGMHKNPRNLLMVATDGIFTLEDIAMPRPKPTGTDAIVIEKTGAVVHKPLGGWERKELRKHLFLARPGVFFPIDPTADELKDVRARGVGKNIIADQWRDIVEAFNAGKSRVVYKELARFEGAKSCVYKVGKEYRRRAEYGQWTIRPQQTSFDVRPKREYAREDGTLALFTLPQDMVSVPYARAAKSVEAEQLKRLREIHLEQPDGYDTEAFADEV